MENKHSLYRYTNKTYMEQYGMPIKISPGSAHIERRRTILWMN